MISISGNKTPIKIWSLCKLYKTNRVETDLDTIHILVFVIFHPHPFFFDKYSYMHGYLLDVKFLYPYLDKLEYRNGISDPFSTLLIHGAIF